MEHHFFAYMYRLRYIERWSLMRNTVKENVAEHSFHVALLAHALCTIANEVYGRQLPTDRAVSMALFHDASEVFTGDIPTPVKHHNPDVLSSFRGIERYAAERLAGMVPPELRAVYKPLLDGKAIPIDEAETAERAGEAATAEQPGKPDAAEPGGSRTAAEPPGEDESAGQAARGKAKLDPVERELRTLVKAADMLDAYIKCATELSAGNREFAVAKRQIGESLARLGRPEVAYFLEHLAPSLEKTLDELSE